MKCQNCYKPIERKTKICPHCGHEKTFVNPSTIFGIILSVLLFLMLYFMVPFPNGLSPFELNEATTKTVTDLNESQSKVDLVEHAQDTVYTVYTDRNQGSAFLYDKNGYIVTNAHVVEGSFTATVKTKNGSEYTGEVIGYSDEVDIALISVPELKDRTPFALEKEANSEVEEEVIALGSPYGLESIATFGYVTGVNRTFNIPPHTFTDVYQISAPIEPGNSGGPLISIDRQKIIAMNAAKNINEENIAYSIPLHQIVPLVDDWIQSPLKKHEIRALFYDDDGNYHYQFLTTLLDYYYFDHGDYLNERDSHYYWIYNDESNLWEQYHYFEPYFQEWNEYDHHFDLDNEDSHEELHSHLDG